MIDPNKKTVLCAPAVCLTVAFRQQFPILRRFPCCGCAVELACTPASGKLIDAGTHQVVCQDCIGAYMVLTKQPLLRCVRTLEQLAEQRAASETGRN